MRSSWFLALAACSGPIAPTELTVGAWTLAWVDGADAITLAGPFGQHFDDVVFDVGAGTQSVRRSAGHFLFEDITSTWTRASAPKLGEDGASIVFDVGGTPLTLAVLPDGENGLSLITAPRDAGSGTPRFRVAYACDADEHVLGLGSHTDGIEHTGEAFSLWVSEQGIGKVDTDIPPDDWFLTGRRHTTYFPVPFLLRAQQSAGLLLDTPTRVEVDLCATDPARTSLIAWDAQPALHFVAAPTPLGAVEALTDRTGRPRRLPAWALTPWNDAIRGADRVREVAATLREAGAPSSVIWTEDWKGSEENFSGFRLSESWTLDETLYPEATTLDAELEAAGFKWFAYFGPFVGLTDADGQDAVARGAVILNPEGQPYDFPGITFQPTSMVDITGTAGRDWATGKMRGAVAAGFDGWMVDFGEWLPTDAILSGEPDPLAWHNLYPAAWQQLSDDVLSPLDGVSFCRSGWAYAATACPIVWLGDQRTSFQTDDGMPTILPMAMGLGVSGLPVTTHDVAGYLSLDNPPSDQELWWRWAWLGAFSPILRVHHGSSDQANHRFDSTPETLDLWVEASTEHMRLFPYRAGLARRASEVGTPMTMPTALVFEGEPWDRIDAWLLGPSLLVAPVMARDVRTLDVRLPAATRWYDWWTLEPASSGPKDVPLDTIAVFVAANSTIPMFKTVPHTLAPTTDPTLLDFDTADAERVVLVVGNGSVFVEADGTTYTPSGTADEAGETTATVQDGSLRVGGLTLQVQGPRARSYTLRVVP